MLCSIQYFENRNSYEILCKNIVEAVRSQYDACLLHAGYLRLQIHTQNVIIIAFSQQQWLHETARMLRYVHVPVCFILKSDTPKHSAVKQNSLV